MKKLLIIVSACLMMVSCEKEELKTNVCSCGTVVEKNYFPGGPFGGPVEFKIEGDCGKTVWYFFHQIEPHLPLGIDTKIGDNVCLPESYWE